MSQPELLCGRCSALPASCFCICAAGETLLCEGCFAVHAQPLDQHYLLPADVYGQHTLPGYFDRLTQRSNSLPAAKEALQKNIEAVDKCIADLTIQINALADQLWKFGNAKIAELNTLKETLTQQITESIAEVEATIYHDSPDLKSPFADLLRDSDNYEVFQFRFEVDSVLAAMSRFLVFSVGAMGQVQTVVPSVCMREYRTVDVKSGKEARGTILGGEFSDGAVFSMADGKTIVGVGGRPATCDAARLAIRTGQITKIGDMTTPRGFSGIQRHGSFIYVFGGYDHSKGFPDSFLTAAEKLSIDTYTWQPLPNMSHPRHMFSPCVFEDDIYLPEVCNEHGVMEKFNVPTEKYKVLQVALPVINENSVAAIVDGELRILTYGGQIARWQVNSPAKAFTIAAYDGSSGDKPQSNTPPVFIENSLYFVHFATGRINTLDWSTGKLSRL